MWLTEAKIAVVYVVMEVRHRCTLQLGSYFCEHSLVPEAIVSYGYKWLSSGCLDI